MIRPAVVLALLCLWPHPRGLRAETAVHYAPAVDLRAIDLALINGARRTIDLAAYSLTDPEVADAVVDAHKRGVAVRIVVDPQQPQAWDRLAPLSGSVRAKLPGPLMHLKSYAVDGQTLRTGSANLSPSGLTQQDNDLVVIRDAGVAARFQEQFARIWRAAVLPHELPKPTGQARGPSRAQAEHAAECQIKGNVSRKGEKIYHMPEDGTYARVTMNHPDKRWFCSEADAEAAGWRRVGRLPSFAR